MEGSNGGSGVDCFVHVQTRGRWGARARASSNAHRAANANGLYAANRHLFRQVTRHIAILLIIQIRVVTPCLVDVR